MKTLVLKSVLFFGLFSFTLIGQAQKKAQTFTVERIIPSSVEKVWAVVGDDYGAVANSHPKIISSNYADGSLKGGEGVERVCNFNEDGTKYVKEKQLSFDPTNHTFKAQIFHSEGLPLDPEYSYAIYTVVPIDENSCKLIIDMSLRTNPAIMGALSKGRFKKTIEDYALAVEHHVMTGENVTADNFKAIKKQYKK